MFQLSREMVSIISRQQSVTERRYKIHEDYFSSTIQKLLSIISILHRYWRLEISIYRTFQFFQPASHLS